MKNARILTFSIFILVTAFLLSCTFPEKNTSPTPMGDKFEIPTDIQEIFDKSCFGCHNSESKSDKAKKKMLFDKLFEISKSKLVAKLDAIAEVVEEYEMPPEKFLEKYPDKKLTKEEAKKLKEWAWEAAEELLK
jgi:hypothetical protein